MPFLQDLKSALSAVALEVEDARASKVNCFLAESKLLALKEVWYYVKEGSWTARKDFADRIVYLIEHGSKVALAEKKFTDQKHINTVLNRANSTLEKKINPNLIKRILSGDITAAMLEFRCSSGSLLASSAFLSEVAELLPKGTDEHRYDLGDCINEAKFLAFYSRAVLDKRLAALDQDKLAYLVHILNTYDTQLLAEQQALYKVLSGEVSAETLKAVNPVFS